MKIKSITPWFGGKRTLAPKIIEQLGPHSQYFEPCCGSLAVLLLKPMAQKETVNDLHGDLVNLARVIADRDRAEDLYERLTRVVICEGLLRDARCELEAPVESADAISLRRAYWYFIASWMSRNGTSGCERQDYQIAVRWTKEGGSPVIRWRNAVDSMPAWNQRLQNVVILNRDLFAIAHKFQDDAATAIYVDPPYLAETRSGFDGASSRYLHEFDNNSSALFGAGDDHSKLADILSGYKKARVVVSYYDCPRVRELYDGWTFIEHTMRKNINQQAARTEFAPIAPKEAPEVLIVNGDPL